MCYGQTGSGKTYTMTGATEKYDYRGIIPRAIQQIFKEVGQQANLALTVYVSYLEIYNETLFDLLSSLTESVGSDGHMTIVEDSHGVHIRGLSIHQVSTEEDALNYLFEGETNRIIASHTMNKNSSRSHCIFTVYVETRWKEPSEVKYLASKLNMVDLAGSERLGKTGLSTLRFASRMICIPAEPAPNVHSDRKKLVLNLQKEIQLLQDELAMHNILTNRRHISYEALTENQVHEVKAQVCRYLDGTLDEINITNLRQLRESFAQFKIILQQQGQEIETALRKKYILIDKMNKATSYTPEPVVTETAEETQVGEVTGEGFGIGQAPTSAKAKKIKTKKGKDSTGNIKKERKDTELPSQVKEAPLPPPHPPPPPPPFVPEKDTAQREHEVLSADSAQSDLIIKLEETKPSTPPPKTLMFDVFKNEKGSEINQILIENKHILIEKRNSLKELTETINNIKEEIDITNRALNVKKQERQDQGEYVNEQGDPVIDEDEFNLIMQLKDLKHQYRHDFDTLRDLRVELQYCQRLVDQCRLRLLTEFNIWYNESFLISDDGRNASQKDSIRPGLIPNSRMLSLEEDDKEKFQRIQDEILMENPGSVAFYKARMKLKQRQNYTKAMAQPQPVLIRKKPGMVTQTIKNKPPSIFSVT
ncbi:kinesin-like protein KIF9 isoform X3 [Cetorhinus maximus]